MMKKLMVLLTALCMVFSCATAFAASLTLSDAGSITLPDDLTVNTQSYATNNTETSMWLFTAECDAFLMEGYLDYLESYEGISLFSLSEEDLQSYISDTVSDLSYDSTTAVYVKTVMAGAVPFAIYAITDEEGAFYYAETIASGWCIAFSMYTEDNELPTAYLGNFEDILCTFEPAV